MVVDDFQSKDPSTGFPIEVPIGFHRDSSHLKTNQQLLTTNLILSRVKMGATVNKVGVS